MRFGKSTNDTQQRIFGCIRAEYFSILHVRCAPWIPQDSRESWSRILNSNISEYFHFRAVIRSRTKDEQTQNYLKTNFSVIFYLLSDLTSQKTFYSINDKIYSVFNTCEKFLNYANSRYSNSWQLFSRLRASSRGFAARSRVLARLV